MSPECAGFAHEPAKLEDQVRFLAATLGNARAKTWHFRRPNSRRRTHSLGR